MRTLVFSLQLHDLSSSLAALKSGISGINKYLPILLEIYKSADTKDLKETPKIPENHLLLLSTISDLMEKAAYNASSQLSLFINNITPINIEQLSLESCSIKNCLQIAIEQFPYKVIEQKYYLSDITEKLKDFFFIGDKVLIINLLLNLFSYIYSTNENYKKIKIYTKITPEINFLYIVNFVKADENVIKFFANDNGMYNHAIDTGLLFCKELMQHLNGKISYTAQDINCSEFILLFPAG